MAEMQWSRLKRNVESLFAESVKGRVGLHSTRYRTMHDHDGRAWITLDGKEIINMVHIWKRLYEVRKRAAAMAGESDIGKWGSHRQFDQAARKELENQSFFTQDHLGGSMHQYQSLSIDQILKSENAVIRSLGMLDRRLGIRRLKKINVETEHPLVKATCLFRCRAEGIETEQSNQ